MPPTTSLLLSPNGFQFKDAHSRGRVTDAFEAYKLLGD